MAIDRDTKDFKLSPSVQAPTRNNRNNHESKPPERNSDQPGEINGYRTHNSPPSPPGTSEQPLNRSEKRKLNMNEFEMWKYSYSLVKNGYSILAPEPSQRSRSYRDLILQEMNWMAVDYYQERRWKSHIAKEISNSINTTIIDRKRLKRDWPAKQCSYNVEVFWLNVKENGETSGISMGLHEYCQKIASGKDLYFNSPDFVEEVPTKRNDLLSITVPVYKNLNTNAVNIAKNEVVNATLNHMLVLGAELYPQVHRPPDDEIDVFTLPALNPKHEFDYNTLLLLLHSLQANMYSLMTKQDFQRMFSNMSVMRNYTPQSSLSSFLPIRRIPREEIDPFSLSVNYRDFLDNNPIQPVHGQKLVLKWEEPTLNESDFELLDSWMLESQCWPLISIALNLRSSSGGLLRREFSPKICEEAFYKISKTPRGLVNSSRKLLGPKQTKTILSFIDSPPQNFRFKLVVPSSNSSGYLKKLTSTSLKSDQKETTVKSLFGDLNKFYKDESKLYSFTTGSGAKKDWLFSKFKFSSETKSDKKLLLRKTTSDKQDIFVVPNNLKVELLSTNSRLKLPVEMEDFLTFDGNMELFNKSRDPNFNRELAQSENTSHVPVRNRFVRFTEDTFGVNHRFSSLNSVVTLATSVTSHDNVVRNVGYSELSTRMNKQLRIGFLGIPTKMFVYSLFYCGRIKPDYRVRRVALSISSISKFIPPPHLLYGKMFDPDVNNILTKNRGPILEKYKYKPLEIQESFASELVQNYASEVIQFTNAKVDENNIPTLLATFTQVALSKGQSCNQSCFSSSKILAAPGSGSVGNLSNSSSTPTERKRGQVNSIDSTPRQRSRTVSDIVQPTPIENPQPTYMTRQETILRRQMMQPQNIQTQNMHQMHQYQQMQMIYGMGQQINPQMGQPVNLGQSMVNSNMNNLNPMNPMMNGKIMYNMPNSQLQHYQEDESYQYRYDSQRSNRHT